MKKEALIEIKHLNVNYKKQSRFSSKQKKAEVIKDLSLEIHEGEIFGLIGESGCGKSTLSKVISGLLPYEGSVYFKGKEINGYGRRERSRQIQMIFQNPYNSLNPEKTVYEILKEPLLIHKMGSLTVKKELITDILEKVGLSASIQGRKVRELSGGQRQRICIACALLLSPRLIIADEILSSLDVSVQANILNLLRDLNQDYNMTMLFVSHDINVITYFCDRIAVMYAGQIVEVGSTADIYENPQHPYTQLLLRSIMDDGEQLEEAASLNENEKEHYHNTDICSFYKYCTKRMEECDRTNPILHDIISIDGESKCHVRCNRLRGKTSGIVSEL